MEDVLLPPSDVRTGGEKSAEIGGEGSLSYHDQDASESKFEPSQVKIEVEETVVNFTEPVSVPEDYFPSDLSDQKVAVKQEEKFQDRLPLTPDDFNGFTDLDCKRALHVVTSRGELLYSYIEGRQQAIREAASVRDVSKRRRPVVLCYREQEDLDDHSIFCDECDREWEGDCPVHGPLEIVSDTKVPLASGDPDRDIKTCPQFVITGRSEVPQAGIGIWTEEDVPARQRFGPFEGTITTGRLQARTTGYIWQLKRHGAVHHLVSAEDSSWSNWLRLVNCARTEEEQNLTAFQHKGQLYFRTCKPIPRGSELLVHVGSDHTPELDITQQPSRKAPDVPVAGPSSSGDGATVGCHHCNRSCLGQHQLDRHIKYRHGHIDRNGRHKCEWCPYSTDKATSLSDHRRTHTGERPHRCDVCGKTFIQFVNLTLHYLVHTGERPHKCDACGKAFKTRSDVAIHRRIHTNHGTTHTGERPHRCDVCGKTFIKFVNLTRHYLVHTGERPHKCDVCGKAFKTRSDMAKHRRIHTAGKVRQCDLCGASFKDSNYSRHMQIHNGVKEHQCHVCSARFVRRTELTVHMRTHTGERPYACSFCSARFSHRSTMRTHVTALHTHDYRRRCDRCGKGYVSLFKLLAHVNKCKAGG